MSGSILIGRSPFLLKLVKEERRVFSGSRILVSGEPGTGKTALAHHLHAVGRNGVKSPATRRHSNPSPHRMGCAIKSGDVSKIRVGGRGMPSSECY